jgi:hypothetical protein
MYAAAVVGICYVYRPFHPAADSTISGNKEKPSWRETKPFANQRELQHHSPFISPIRSRVI